MKFILSLFIGISLGLSSQAADTLPSLKERVETLINAAEKSQTEGLARLNESYGATMKAYQDKAGENLELNALLDVERQKLAAGTLITLDKTAPEWLQKAQTNLMAQRGELAQKRALEIQGALRSYQIGLEKLEAGLKNAGLPADIEMVAAERKALPQMAKSLGVSLVTPTEQRPVAVATAKSGPPPRADQVWESRVSGETVEFVWVPAMQTWVGRFEVTRGQFKKFRPGLAVDAAGSRLPVTGIKYDDMYDYAEWLTRAERAGGGLPESMRIRLPTESEWESLAGSGKSRSFPWGADWPPTRGNYGVITGPKFLWFGKKTLYDDGNAEACPVEDSGENEWGLFGVGGNVWEACGKYTVSRGFSAWRGGCYANTARSLMQIDARNLASGDEADPSHGFRIMLGK